jgi:hypothetical protein
MEAFERAEAYAPEPLELLWICGGHIYRSNAAAAPAFDNANGPGQELR